MTYATPTNISGIAGIFQYANQVTTWGGVELFVALFLVTLYLVPLIYMLMRKDDWVVASMVSGFFVSIGAILLRVAEVTTSERYVFIAIATLVFPIVLALFQERN